MTAEKYILKSVLQCTSLPKSDLPWIAVSLTTYCYCIKLRTVGIGRLFPSKEGTRKRRSHQCKRKQELYGSFYVLPKRNTAAMRANLRCVSWLMQAIFVTLFQPLQASWIVRMDSFFEKCRRKYVPFKNSAPQQTITYCDRKWINRPKKKNTEPHIILESSVQIDTTFSSQHKLRRFLQSNFLQH